MYFDKPYNRTIFLNLLQSKMFPNFVRKEEHLGFGNKTAYFVENGIYKLGTVNLDKEITILEIEQKSSNDPRITLTKDAFKILEYHGIDHAIIIFHCKDTTSYRLSLLTVSYENWEKKTSSYKRFSYILGPNEKVKTPERELLHSIKDYEDLKNRFKVEVVRDQFFDEYLELFVRLYKAVQNDKPFVELLETQNVDVVSFTKNLLGKIIFLYFIQKKGWLGLGRNTTTKYGEGNRDFMRVLWNNFKKNNESMSTEKTGYFYNDYLERLFFAGLNTDRRDNDDWFPNLQMKVPYLNGGLFKEEYTGWESYVTKIDNRIFSNYDEKGDDADGILDIFDRYNFTIDEDSLYDRDIAVDPEMLGRIFEKMISISNKNIDEVIKMYDEIKAAGKGKFDFGDKLNKDLGAFYTPREVVHYMTKECLSGYLQTKTKCSEEEISKLFALKEKFLLDKRELNESGFSKEFLQNINDALKQVKVLDPAVGSGAYPMGLLHEISGLRYYLYGAFHSDFGDIIDEFKNEEGKISLYKIKKDIILNNIYGVDIDPGAIDIAKLRFWLSLVVDAQEPEPLPNFEFKFVCANSLIALADETREKDLFSSGDEPKLETLKKYKRDFYNASSKQEKKELKNRIIAYTKTENTLFGEPTLRAKQIEEFGKNFDNSKHSHSFFDSSLMLSEWRGFNIVIGNPPYGANIDLQIKYFEKRYPETSKGFKDIYKYFFDQGLRMLVKNGILCYITPSTFLYQPRYGDLRKLMLKNSIKQIINMGEGVFNVVVPVAISLISKSDEQSIVKFTDLTKEEDVIKALNYMKFKEIDQKVYNTTQNNIFVENIISLKDNQDILDNILLFKDAGINYQRVNVGLHEKGKSDLSQRLLYEGYKENSNDVEYWKGVDINSFYISESTNRYCRPNINLAENERVILNRDYFSITPKLLRRQTAPYPICAVDYKGIWFGRSIQAGILKPKYEIIISYEYLCGLLNSRYLRKLYEDNVKEGGRVFPQVKLEKLKPLPIVIPNEQQQKDVVELVKKIMEMKKQGINTIDVEKQLDLLVYKLYDLTNEEIKTVEDSVK